MAPLQAPELLSDRHELEAFNSGAMCLEMCRIDLQLLRDILRGQGFENTIENSQLAPPYEAILKGLVWATFGGRVSPLKSPLQHMDNPA